MTKQEEFLDWLNSHYQFITWRQDTDFDLYGKIADIEIRVSPHGEKGKVFIQAYDDVEYDMPSLDEKDYPIVQEIYRNIKDKMCKDSESEYWGRIMNKLNAVEWRTDNK